MAQSVAQRVNALAKIGTGESTGVPEAGTSGDQGVNDRLEDLVTTTGHEQNEYPAAPKVIRPSNMLIDAVYTLTITHREIDALVVDRFETGWNPGVM